MIQFHDVTLPGGRAYPPIQIRQFGPTEVEAYDRVKRQGSEAALKALIGTTVQGIDVNDLYEPDFLFTMIWHRVNSFIHYPMRLPWTCPTCETENSDNLDLTKLISDELPEDYDPQGMTLDLPCGIPITFRLPKVGDDAKARSLLASMGIGNANEAQTNKAELVQLMEYDTNFNGMEKWEIVNKAFTVEDIFTIDAFRRTYNFGPRTVLKCNCNQCGGQQNVGFRFSLLEFLPTDFDGTNLRARILPARSSKDAAKRAKDAVLPKTPVAPTTPPPQARRTIPTEEPVGGQHQSSPRELQGQSSNAPQPRAIDGNNLPLGSDDDAPVSGFYPAPNGNGQQTQSPLRKVTSGDKIITPHISQLMAGQLAEQARTETGTSHRDTFLSESLDGQKRTASDVIPDR